MKPTYLISELYLDIEASYYLFIHGDIKICLLPLQRELLNNQIKCSGFSFFSFFPRHIIKGEKSTKGFFFVLYSTKYNLSGITSMSCFVLFNIENACFY